jgi:hypothetical protein
MQVASDKNADGSVDVTVTTDKLALYVTLTTLAQGYFSENAYVPHARLIHFCQHSVWLVANIVGICTPSCCTRVLRCSAVSQRARC